MVEKKEQLDQEQDEAMLPQTAEPPAEQQADPEQEQQEKGNPEVCSNYAEIEKMRAAIEEKNRLLAEQAERYKRLQADYDNFRRRTRQEKEELSAIVAQGIIRELLPVVDNFERALASAATQDAAGLLSGVEMIYRQFAAALGKNGLTAIEAVGKIFDPQQHEAVMRVEDDSQPEGTILEELQKGYFVQGKVVRPSMVKVAGK
ncbi:MAG: nucleotide exchange factor GrpE [Veillonellales bacterium]